MEDFIDSRGRGTILQPGNRFENQTIEWDPSCFEEIARVDVDFQPDRPTTKCYADETQSVISKNSLSLIHI